MFSTNRILEGFARPARSQRQFMQHVAAGKRLKKVPEIPDAWWNLIERCWDSAPDQRPEFKQIVNELLQNDMVIDGTNMVEYKEYQARMTQPIEEDVEMAKVVDSIIENLSTTKKVTGMTVMNEAARGDGFCVGQYRAFMTRSAILGMEHQARRPFVFKRKESAFD